MCADSSAVFFRIQQNPTEFHRNWQKWTETDRRGKRRPLKYNTLTVWLIDWICVYRVKCAVISDCIMKCAAGSVQCLQLATGWLILIGFLLSNNCSLLAGLKLITQEILSNKYLISLLMNSGKAQTFQALSQTSKIAELSNLNVKILHKGDR